VIGSSVEAGGTSGTTAPRRRRPPCPPISEGIREHLSQGGGAAHAANAEVPLRAERRISTRARSPADTGRALACCAGKATAAPAQDAGETCANASLRAEARKGRARARSAAKIRQAARQKSETAVQKQRSQPPVAAPPREQQAPKSQGKDGGPQGKGATAIQAANRCGTGQRARESARQR